MAYAQIVTAVIDTLSSFAHLVREVFNAVMWAARPGDKQVN